MAASLPWCRYRISCALSRLAPNRRSAQPQCRPARLAARSLGGEDLPIANAKRAKRIAYFFYFCLLLRIDSQSRIVRIGVMNSIRTAHDHDRLMAALAPVDQAFFE